jgi:hypothetical protein
LLKKKVPGGGVALFQVLLLLHAYSFAKSLLIGQETEEPNCRIEKLHVTQQMHATLLNCRALNSQPAYYDEN